MTQNEVVEAAPVATEAPVSTFDRVVNTLQQNPYFNAGAGLAGMGEYSLVFFLQ